MDIQQPGLRQEVKTIEEQERVEIRLHGEHEVRKLEQQPWLLINYLHVRTISIRRLFLQNERWRALYNRNGYGRKECSPLVSSTKEINLLAGQTPICVEWSSEINGTVTKMDSLQISSCKNMGNSMQTQTSTTKQDCLSHRITLTLVQWQDLLTTIMVILFSLTNNRNYDSLGWKLILEAGLCDAHSDLSIAEAACLIGYELMSYMMSNEETDGNIRFVGPMAAAVYEMDAPDDAPPRKTNVVHRKNDNRIKLYARIIRLVMYVIAYIEQNPYGELTTARNVTEEDLVKHHIRAAINWIGLVPSGKSNSVDLVLESPVHQFPNYMKGKKLYQIKKFMDSSIHDAPIEHQIGHLVEGFADIKLYNIFSAGYLSSLAFLKELPTIVEKVRSLERGIRDPIPKVEVSREYVITDITLASRENWNVWTEYRPEERTMDQPQGDVMEVTVKAPQESSLEQTTDMPTEDFDEIKIDRRRSKAVSRRDDRDMDTPTSKGELKKPEFQICFVAKSLTVRSPICKDMDGCRSNWEQNYSKLGGDIAKLIAASLPSMMESTGSLCLYREYAALASANWSNIIQSFEGFPILAWDGVGLLMDIGIHNLLLMADLKYPESSMNRDQTRLLYRNMIECSIYEWRSGVCYSLPWTELLTTLQLLATSGIYNKMDGLQIAMLLTILTIEVSWRHQGLTTEASQRSKGLTESWLLGKLFVTSPRDKMRLEDYSKVVAKNGPMINEDVSELKQIMKSMIYADTEAQSWFKKITRSWADMTAEPGLDEYRKTIVKCMRMLFSQGVVLARNIGSWVQILQEGVAASYERQRKISTGMLWTITSNVPAAILEILMDECDLRMDDMLLTRVPSLHSNQRSAFIAQTSCRMDWFRRYAPPAQLEIIHEFLVIHEIATNHLYSHWSIITAICMTAIPRSMAGELSEVWWKEEALDYVDQRIGNMRAGNAWEEVCEIRTKMVAHEIGDNITSYCACNEIAMALILWSRIVDNNHLKIILNTVDLIWATTIIDKQTFYAETIKDFESSKTSPSKIGQLTPLTHHNTTSKETTCYIGFPITFAKEIEQRLHDVKKTLLLSINKHHWIHLVKLAYNEATRKKQSYYGSMNENEQRDRSLCQIFMLTAYINQLLCDMIELGQYERSIDDTITLCGGEPEVKRRILDNRRSNHSNLVVMMTTMRFLRNYLVE